VQYFQIILLILLAFFNLQLHFSSFLLFWALHNWEETTHEFGVRFWA